MVIIILFIYTIPNFTITFIIYIQVEISPDSFGSKSIFRCDKNGNNALHLCVIHSLPDMYKCVYDTAVELLIQKLRKIYCDSIMKNFSKEGTEIIYKLELSDCLTLKKDQIFIPNKKCLKHGLILQQIKLL